MATNPIIRTHFTFTELMAHWQCSENDLRDAIVSQRLVPSIHVIGAVWELALDTSGKRTRLTTGIYINEMMYLIDVARLGASDCAFNFYSRDPDALTHGSVFKADGNGYVDIRKRMADVEKDGRFLAVEVARSQALFGALSQPVSTTLISSVAGRWWATEYDVINMANGIKEEWKKQRRGVIQSGSRHGEYGRFPIGEAVAKKIQDAEKANTTNRTIGGKSIANFLKENKWN